MISKTGEAETITSHYLFALGAYRALYIVNWAFRFYMESFYDWIAIVAGCVQTALYIDFFYLYITKGLSVEELYSGTSEQRTLWDQLLYIFRTFVLYREFVLIRRYNSLCFT